jgi:hypothetical protein
MHRITLLIEAERVETQQAVAMIKSNYIYDGNSPRVAQATSLSLKFINLLSYKQQLRGATGVWYACVFLELIDTISAAVDC